MALQFPNIRAVHKNENLLFQGSKLLPVPTLLDPASAYIEHSALLMRWANNLRTRYEIVRRKHPFSCLVATQFVPAGGVPHAFHIVPVGGSVLNILAKNKIRVNCTQGMYCGKQSPHQSLLFAICVTAAVGCGTSTIKTEAHYFQPNDSTFNVDFVLILAEHEQIAASHAALLSAIRNRQ